MLQEIGSRRALHQGNGNGPLNLLSCQYAVANFSCTAKLKETDTGSKLFIPTQDIKLKAKWRVFRHLISHIKSTVGLATAVTKDTCARWAVSTRSEKKLRLEDEPMRLLDE